MISTSDFKKGVLIELDNAPCIIETLQVQTPSARGASTLYKIRVRNLKSGQRIDKSFRGGDVLPEPDFEKKGIQFLYKDGDNFYFMDLADYNQFSIPDTQLKEEAGYLHEDLEGIKSLIYNGEVIGIEIPTSVDIEVEECPPPGMSKSATPRPKEAKLKTGKVVLVPDYIDQGELIRVDTRTGEFVSRAGK